MQSLSQKKMTSKTWKNGLINNEGGAVKDDSPDSPTGCAERAANQEVL